ncbi:MAG: metallophosphoesterase family protein [Verrucomicrobia bacterium]|jgi:acid phosphatase type 7|nr:metallophosphoesterase family protein [Verrucomicrobiota bacterium]
MRRFILTQWILSIALFHGLLHAHVGEHPSIHDTVASITVRMKSSFTEQELKSLTAFQVEQFLNAEEKAILSNEHIHFKVNVPVVVSIIRDRSLKSQPFWIRENGWTLTGLVMKVKDVEVDVWQKSFPAGGIGLGVNSLGTGGVHYIPLLKPQNEGDLIEVSNIYPGQIKAAIFKDGVKLYSDQEDTLPTVPDAFKGSVLIQADYGSRQDASLVSYFKWTEHPSSPQPDQVVLTWSDDPQTTQTIQWRTDSTTREGFVDFQKKSDFNRFNPKPLVKVVAKLEVLKTPNIINDPVSHRYFATLIGLEPDTTYVYSVGDGSENGWSELSEFTTAPSRVEPFSFIYMGDAQNGLDRWGSLVHNAFRERPDAAFYIMAGDLVNRGNDRDDWDSFFYNAEDIYDRRQLVPVIGNHENQGGHPTLYLRNFDLFKNGPEAVEKERAYSFEYSNALFVVLDSNIKPETQTKWLEKVLSETKAKWKFVTYHHPAYSSAPSRDNASIRKQWLPLFDKYHVDLALQGHDHAYLRTFPMKGEKKVASPKEGTVYIVSVSGTKMYSQEPSDYIEFGMTNTSTYQVLDVQISGDRLVYRAYDIDGKLKDELVIQK